MCLYGVIWQVNIIPIIAKSDTIAKTELTRFKGRVSQQHHKLKVPRKRVSHEYSL